MSVRILNGDMLLVLPTMEADSIDACVCDPPYHLTNNTGSRSPNPGQYTPIGKPKQPRGGFMGKQWDGGDIAFRLSTWAHVYRVLKPGAHLLAFGGTRTYHRLVCAIEDAGFEVRDTIGWLYGSGLPKSHDVSKGIDKAAGAVRTGAVRTGDGTVYGLGHTGTITPDIPCTPGAEQWSGWGTSLKPGMELVCVARKPLSERTVVANVLRHGTGAINIDACRIELANGEPLVDGLKGDYNRMDTGDVDSQWGFKRVDRAPGLGRWPANVCHDGSEEVVAGFPETESTNQPRNNQAKDEFFTGKAPTVTFGHADSGSAARYFYTAKADASDRAGSRHPTVKPTDLMRWLVRLVTPPGGTVLDPFCGTGSTLVAADQQQFNAIGIEADETYAADARRKFVADAGLFANIETIPVPSPPEDRRLEDLWREPEIGK